MTGLLELFVLGVWTGIGFLATLLVSRWLRVRGSIGGAPCDNCWINLDSGADLCLTVVGDVWNLDIERSLLLWPLESGTAFFIKTFERQPVSDFGSSVWARSW
eukprot:g72669.t1